MKTGITRLLILCFLFTVSICLPVKAANTPLSLLPTDPRPLYKTSIKMDRSDLALKWYEDKTYVRGTYHLINPTENKKKLTMCIPVAPVTDNSTDLLDNKPAILIHLNENELEYRYNKSSKLYLWEISFKPNEEFDLVVEYTLANTTTEKGLVMTGFNQAKTGLWSSEPEKFTISLDLSGINPGQIKNISPGLFKFSGNRLVWPEGISFDKDGLLVTADIENEKTSWIEKLNDDDKALLDKYIAEKQYDEASSLYENCWEKAAAEDQEPLRIAQAYYLEKCGRQEEASIIWKELSDHDTESPRVYWVLGQEYKNQTSRLTRLYSKVRELQINPLLQAWLAAQIPPSKTEPSEPIIEKLEFDEGNGGLLFNSILTDEDGDIKNIILRYNWEEDPVEEKSFDLQPFCYEHDISLSIPAKQPFFRLFYELTVIDSSGNCVTTGPAETFYLNSDIPVEQYSMKGGTLVLGDFNPSDHDKVLNWFKSYLKMAKEAKFITIEAKRPYFIFLGKPHDFIDQYKGPLFLLYTPTPFADKATKPYVHRYFLSYWYGEGWNNLPEKQLLKLGDGLLLGKGFYVLTLNYLKDKDPVCFDALLKAVGQGNDWEESLQELYKMEPAEICLRSIWHAYGYNVLALFIIVTFAWLGKTGYLVRFITFLRAGRSS